MENYTCALLIKRVKEHINDQEFSDETIQSFLNSIQFEVLGEERYQFLEKLHQYDEIGSGEIVLPLDYQSTLLVTLSGRKLDYMPSKDYLSSPVPGCYTIYANKLYVENPHDGVPGNLQHFYIAKPYYMDPDDEPIIPYEFMDVLVYGTLALVERSRDNYDFAEVWRKHQDELILNMKQRYGMRQQSVAKRALPKFRRMGRID